MTTRRELVEALRVRYREAAFKDRTTILDEFVALTGDHRKHAIRVLHGEVAPAVGKRTRNRLYDEAVRQVLVVLWEAADRVCGKRLKALIPILVDAMERHGHLDLDPVIRAKVLQLSAATIDRELAATRRHIDGQCKRRMGVGAVIRRSIPAFTSPTLPGIAAIALLPDGDLVLGGTSSGNNFAIAHYLSGTSAVIEFYHAALDHYFLSMNPQEVADLDLGVHSGWTRTGQSFPVFGSLAAANFAAAGVANFPVRRFDIPPQHGDSHFFSVNPVDCAAALAKAATDPNFSGYVEETTSAFFLGVPNSLTGACPAGTMPVYRLWNQRFDSNHRYTVDPAIKAQMIARGYVAEGNGPDSMAMCTRSEQVIPTP